MHNKIGSGMLICFSLHIPLILVNKIYEKGLIYLFKSVQTQKQEEMIYCACLDWKRRYRNFVEKKIIIARFHLLLLLKKKNKGLFDLPKSEVSFLSPLFLLKKISYELHINITYLD